LTQIGKMEVPSPFEAEKFPRTRWHSTTVEKYTANEGGSSNSPGPTETKELSLPLPCPYIDLI
jgi:hypothetical protein